MSFMFALLLIASISMGEALQASRPGSISGEWVSPVKRHQRASLALKGWSWGDEGNARELRRLDEARELRQEAIEQRRLEFLSNSLIMMANASRENSMVMANVSRENSMMMANVYRENSMMMANASRENSKAMNRSSRNTSISIAVGYVVLIAICLVINRKDPAEVRLLADIEGITAYLNKNKRIICGFLAALVATIVGEPAVKLITFISGLFK
jgi:hypothetical protein